MPFYTVAISFCMSIFLESAITYLQPELIKNHCCPVNQKIYPLRGNADFVCVELQYFIRYAENSP